MITILFPGDSFIHVYQNLLRSPLPSLKAPVLRTDLEALLLGGFET